MSKSRDIADSAATINYIDTVTSNVQDQIDNIDPLPSQTGQSGKFLTTDGSVASWDAVDVSSEITGTLPVANGGTGATSLTANNVILGNGTSAVQVVAPGSSGNVLTSNGTTWTSAAAPSGALTFITSSTVSGTPQFLDVTWSGTTYDDYLIVFENFRGNSTHRFAFRAYNSSGVIVTIPGTYYSSGIKWEGSAQGVTQTGNDYIEPFANNNSGSNTAVFFGFLWVLNANTSTNYAAQVSFNCISRSISGGSGISGGSFGGFCWDYSAAPGMRGIRIFDAVGNGITSGTMRLYGVQKS